MKKTLAFYLTLLATVLILLALVFYLTSGIVMPYVTALTVAAAAAGALYLVFYSKLGGNSAFALLVSLAAVLAIGALGFSLIAEVESLGYLISGLRQWKDVSHWAYFAIAAFAAWLLLLVASFLKTGEENV